MSKKTTMIIVGVLVAIIIGLAVGMFILKSKPAEPVKPPTYSVTTEEMYSNVKDSNRIVRIKITVETTDEEDLEEIMEKEYLIRDVSNKLIRATEEKDLLGPEAQENLQERIKKQLIEQLEIDSISRVRFSDFVIQ